MLHPSLPVPTTELEAVNLMLLSVGQGKVTTLIESETAGLAIQARDVLQGYSKQLQALGWYFNQEEEYVLTPSSVDGTIRLPENAVAVWGCEWRDADRFFCQRGDKLYDLRNHTFVWILGSDGTSFTRQPLINGILHVNIRWVFPFEFLPQALRWFVMAKAGRMFATGRDPDSLTYKFTDTIAQEAEAAAYQYDSDSASQWPSQNPHLAMMRQR